jgi:hypothetical protein
LDEEGIDPSAYDLMGGRPSEAYCLEEGAEGWFVYYSERGAATCPRTFVTEDEACSYPLRLILDDPLTRSP